LALHMTVAQLERSMTQRELLDWQRFESVHQPLPDRLGDLHTALLASIIVNLARSADATPARPADFLVIREPEPPPPDDGLSEVDRQMLAWRGG
jgi:hypothetical protein